MVFIALFSFSVRAQEDKAMRMKDRALVLGGGGPVGEAWESGIIAGLAEKGIDLSRADLIIGTSAGAIVGARLASGLSPADLVKAAIPRADSPSPGQAATQAPSRPPDLSFLINKFREMDAGKLAQETGRMQIGAWALTAPPIVSEAGFVASYQRRFPGPRWPSPRYECTSIAATDGSLRVWKESSGVPIALAVASSCALPGLFAPVTIDGHRYMDGGVRATTNVDLASGYEAIVVLAPTVGNDNPIATHGDLPNQIKMLRSSGSTVVLIAPDAASLKAFGANLGDEGLRSVAADAGLVQGRLEAGALAKAWQP